MVVLKELHKQRKSDASKLINPAPNSRHDQVYQEGIGWLESLSGEKITSGDISVEFSNAVWKDNDMNIEEIARVAHQANKAYCESLGDMSHVDWEHAPKWQRKSAITGVNMHINNPEAGPQASHDSWMNEKLLDGWVYGELKDFEAKTHPCLVSFFELPHDEQSKDYIFRAIVHAMA
jgi:hypothetical protein